MINKNRLLCLLLFLWVTCLFVSGQKSLLAELKTCDEDTCKSRLYSDLFRFHFEKSEFEEAKEYADQIIQLGNDKNLVEVQIKGNIYYGEYFSKKSEYSSSIKHYLKALKLAEKNKLEDFQSTCLIAIGNVLNYQRKYVDAEKYYLRALHLALITDDQNALEIIYNNLGAIAQTSNQNDKALEYYFKSTAITLKLKDSVGYAGSLTNIGNIYFIENQYDSALNYYFSSLAILKRYHVDYETSITCLGIGQAYNSKGEFEKALLFHKESMAYAIKVQSYYLLRIITDDLADIHYQMGNYKEAFDYKDMHSNYNDSVYNEEMLEQSSKLEAQYASGKKEAEIEFLKVEKKQQQTIIWLVIAGFAVMLILAFFAYRNYKKQKKAHLLLKDKNREIMDGIHYARRIQRALLPNSRYMEKYLKYRNKK